MRAHPRMRGEHGAALLRVLVMAGSSPHARGTLAASLLQHSPIGLIPACAGNTYDFLPLAELPGAHPRMRGEHKPPPSKTESGGGSSPHARGTLISLACLALALGLIPACAGNTVLRGILRVSLWAHPRMRGEHIL